jgi:hypothetical protein
MSETFGWSVGRIVFVPPDAAVEVPVVPVLLSGGCSDELLPIREDMSSPLLNTQLCSDLHLVAAVHDADVVTGSATVNSFFGATSLPLNALTCLRPAYKQQLLLQQHAGSSALRDLVVFWPFAKGLVVTLLL